MARHRCPGCGRAPAGGPAAGRPRSGSGGRYRCRQIPAPSSPSRADQPGAGRARAACKAASSGVSSSGRLATSSSTRRARPRARDRPPSAPSSQRRSSAVSWPDRVAENAEIGGVEQVVAFVEHVAGRHGVVVEAAPGRLRHHQGVVGDHQFGGAGAADGVLDEAFPPMRCRRRGCTRRGGRPGWRAGRCRTARRTSRAGRRLAGRRRRSPAPSGRSGPAGRSAAARSRRWRLPTASSRFSRHR